MINKLSIQLKEYKNENYLLNVEKDALKDSLVQTGKLLQDKIDDLTKELKEKNDRIVELEKQVLDTETKLLIKPKVFKVPEVFKAPILYREDITNNHRIKQMEDEIEGLAVRTSIEIANPILHKANRFQFLSKKLKNLNFQKN